VKSVRLRADVTRMLRNNRPPMSNTERSRRFRLAHPGYYARIHGRKRASAKKDGERLWQEQRQAIAAQLAALAPPAPVQALEIPHANSIVTGADLVAIASV